MALAASVYFFIWNYIGPWEYNFFADSLATHLLFLKQLEARGLHHLEARSELGCPFPDQGDEDLNILKFLGHTFLPIIDKIPVFFVFDVYSG